MGRKRSLIEILSYFLLAVIVLTGFRASAMFFYGPPISTVFSVLFYLAILGFIGTLFYGFYRLVTKAGKP
jgi:hypothetical protein